MKKHLHKLFMSIFTLATIGFANAQSYSFEGGTVDGDPIPGWTGSFNSSAVYDSAEDALEYVRTDSNNSLRLDAPTTIDATATNYVRIKYKNLGGATQLRVKATAGTDDNSAAFTITTTTDYVNKYFLLGDKATWDDAAESILFQFRLNYSGGEGAVFIKEIEFLQVDPSTFEDFLGFESADEEEPGVIQPAANGKSTVTGWFIQNFDEWSFSDAVVRSGDYSAKFDATTSGTTAKKMQGGGSTSPANSKLNLAVGSWGVTAYVYIPTGSTVPSVLKFNAKDPINNFTINLDANLAKDTWHFVESSAVTVSSANVDDGYNLIAEGRDTSSLMYVDDVAIVDAATLSSKPLNAIEFSVFPNPSNDFININSKEKIESYTIVDLLGKTVISRKYNKETINISSLAKGVYILQLSSEKGIASKKIVKE